jgi:AcrR family transcriptional regulator
MKKPRRRRYALKVRGEKMILGLHQEVGPAQTTVSAIAARAGVERLTVYRHFNDEKAMLAACSQRHLELNPFPDPAAWAGEPDPARRTRRGLGEVCAFFGRTAPMFAKTYRDAGTNPAVREIMGRLDARLREVADGLAASWPGAGREAARVRLILRHAVRFSTWQSFEDERLDDAGKVELFLGWLSAGRKPAAATEA